MSESRHRTTEQELASTLEGSGRAVSHKPSTDWHPTTVPQHEDPFFMSWYPWDPDYVLLTRGPVASRPTPSNQRWIDSMKLKRPDKDGSVGEFPPAPGRGVISRSWIKIGCTYVNASLIRELYWTCGLAPRWLQHLHDFWVQRFGARRGWWHHDHDMDAGHEHGHHDHPDHHEQDSNPEEKGTTQL